MFCTNCGANAANAFFCPNCGSRIAQQQPPAAPRNEQPMAPMPGGPPRQSKTAVVVASVLAGVLMVVVLGAAGVWLANRDDDAGASATLADHPAGTPTATPTTSDAPDSAKKKAKRKAAGPGDVRGLSAGLFCRDLNARGYSYVAATDYWRRHGQPNQMDADRNGIPCETVYPPTDVSAYWSHRELPQAASAGSGFLPSGLFCRDLYARGVSYPDAVAYWWQEGAPDRMDVELNGIPCETVYSSYEINTYW